jgi:tetratricopeptide (TPR) repeat protein
VLDELRIEADIIRLNPPTIDNLRFALATGKFDIIHIASHGDATGMDFEDIDGTAYHISVQAFAQLFQNSSKCLVVINGCTTEPVGDELARISGNVTTISIAGGILRQSALRAISTIYRLIFAGMAPDAVASEVSRILLIPRGDQSQLAVSGRNSGESAFIISVGNGRPNYYACMPRTNIQPRRMPIFDRENEMLSLHTALVDGGPYIGLVGITGIGKTALLQAAIYRYGWRFTDGIGYLSLRADLSLANLADIFNWPAHEEESTYLDISTRLSDGRYLLIFDDAEDAPPDAVTEMLALLDRWDTSLGSRAVVVLHTRRIEFGDAIGVNWIPVRGLPPTAARDLIESRLGSKEEARRKIGTDVALVPDLCFGHPKTIESTASLLQLGERWSEVKGDLVRLSGEGPLSANDEIMGRIIGRLEGREPGVRDLLDAWTVFEDRCREAVWRKVATGDSGDPVLRRNLIDSALRALQGATLIERYDDDHEARCVMHPLLVSHLRRRHASLTNEKIRSFVRSQLQQQVEMTSADRFPGEEAGNVRRTLQLGKQLSMWPVLLAYCENVAGDADLPLVRRGPWPLARDILDLAVEAAENIGDKMKAASFLLVRGIVEYRLAELGKAESVYQSVVHLAEITGDDKIWLSAMHGWGRVRYRMGDFDAAQEIYSRAKNSEHKDTITLAHIDHEYGKVLYRKEDLDGARTLFDGARRVRQDAGLYRPLARSLHELARVEHAAGDLPTARRLYTEALELERSYNDPVTEQATLFQLGRLALDEGSAEEAANWFEASAKVTTRLGDRIWMAHDLYGQALLAKARGDIEMARSAAERAIAESRRLGIGLTKELTRWLDTIPPSNEIASKGKIRQDGV